MPQSPTQLGTAVLDTHSGWGAVQKWYWEKYKSCTAPQQVHLFPKMWFSYDFAFAPSPSDIKDIHDKFQGNWEIVGGCTLWSALSKQTKNTIFQC